jgi:hypothetical protein
MNVCHLHKLGVYKVDAQVEVQPEEEEKVVVDWDRLVLEEEMDESVVELVQPEAEEEEEVSRDIVEVFYASDFIKTIQSQKL